MRRWWCLLASLGTILAGCSDAANRCGVETTTGACVSVLSITPITNGFETTNVDVVQGTCPPPAGDDMAEPTSEPFRDHDAVITLSNQPPILLRDDPEQGPAIVISSYTVEYKLNSTCQGSCPILSRLEFDGPTVTIASGNSGQVSVPMVPLRTKLLEFADGTAGDEFPLYSALYTIHGKDPQGDFEIEAAAEFTAGNYDYCDQ